MVRSRPYQKNDNAHVEQRNYTHVRELFGYERLENKKAVELMNDIYANYWNPLNNFFLPTMKLKNKFRIGARIKKVYGRPKTPYQRLLESPNFGDWRKRKLKHEIKKLNPFLLKKGLENKLEELKMLLTGDVMKLAA